MFCLMHYGLVGHAHSLTFTPLVLESQWDLFEDAVLPHGALRGADSVPWMESFGP